MQDENFGSFGNDLSMWKFYNLLTGANKSSYTLILSWIEPITQQRLQQALTLPYMVMRDTSGLLIKLSK